MGTIHLLAPSQAMITRPEIPTLAMLVRDDRSACRAPGFPSRFAIP
jgi:hypothetical protein